MLDWRDKRPIEELRFGTEWKPTLGHLHAQQPGFGEPDAPFGLRKGDPPGDEIVARWTAMHAKNRALVLNLLKRCNCATAGDVVMRGCTGAVELGCTVDEAKFLRLGLGGSGMGLPCFVSPDRYCLVHEVSGGLQDGQEPRHPNAAMAISRPLTVHEKMQSTLLDHAKGSTEAVASDLLAGRKLPEGWEHDESESPEPSAEMQAAVRASGYRVPLALQNWQCPEHPKTMWACRYCVAQAIVEGELVPEFLVGVLDPTGGGVRDVKAHDLEAFIETKSAEHCVQVDVHVLVARYTRKLAR